MTTLRDFIEKATAPVLYVRTFGGLEPKGIPVGYREPCPSQSPNLMESLGTKHNSGTIKPTWCAAMVQCGMTFEGSSVRSIVCIDDQRQYDRLALEMDQNEGR